MDGWMKMRAIWKRRARYTHPPSSKMTQIGAIAAFGRRRETSPSILEGVSEQMRGLEEEEEEGAFRSPLEGEAEWEEERRDRQFSVSSQKGNRALS